MNDSRGRSSLEGARPPRTSATSAARRRSTSGCVARKCGDDPVDDLGPRADRSWGSARHRAGERRRSDRPRPCGRAPYSSSRHVNRTTPLERRTPLTRPSRPRRLLLDRGPSRIAGRAGRSRDVVTRVRPVVAYSMRDSIKLGSDIQFRISCLPDIHLRVGGNSMPVLPCRSRARWWRRTSGPSSRGTSRCRSPG